MSELPGGHQGPGVCRWWRNLGTELQGTLTSKGWGGERAIKSYFHRQSDFQGGRRFTEGVNRAKSNKQTGLGGCLRRGSCLGISKDTGNLRKSSVSWGCVGDRSQLQKIRIEREKWGLYVLMERRIIEYSRGKGRRKVLFHFKVPSLWLSSGSGEKGMSNGVERKVQGR